MDFAEEPRSSSRSLLAVARRIVERSLDHLCFHHVATVGADIEARPVRCHVRRNEGHSNMPVEALAVCNARNAPSDVAVANHQMAFLGRRTRETRREIEANQLVLARALLN